MDLSVLRAKIRLKFTNKTPFKTKKKQSNILRCSEETFPYLKKTFMKNYAGTYVSLSASNSNDPFGFVRNTASDGQLPHSRWSTMSPNLPFWDGGFNMYRLSVMSRGLYAPIRPAATGCPANNRIACEPSKRQVEDPWCRTPFQQVSDALSEIIGEHPYTLVEPD